MKKQNSIYIALVIILTASAACSVGGTAPSTEGGQTNPVATTVPAQEAGGNDGSAGPETIDLTNPALYIIPNSPAYKFESTTKYTGVDTTGGTKEVSLLMTEETQSLPQNSRHFIVEVIGGEGSAETVVIGDQVYTVFQGTCYPSPLSSVEVPARDWPKLQDEITGQAPRVESGIEVNGYVTDKYELSSENLVGDRELISAFVYVARDGGFITLYETQNQEKMKGYGFDPNQFTDISLAYNYIPVEDGSLIIAIPAECNQQ